MGLKKGVGLGSGRGLRGTQLNDEFRIWAGLRRGAGLQKSSEAWEWAGLEKGAGL